MVDVALIGVPFDGYGRPGNQARAAHTLRRAGLPGAFGGHRVVTDTDLHLPQPDPSRGVHTGLINEAALTAMTATLADSVAAALTLHRFPVVVGGDCAALLGIVAGFRRHAGDIGLVFVDGHEDTMPLDVSEDGEAANTEIGLLLGLTGRSLKGPLAELLPDLARDELAVIGPRDEAWRAQFNVGTLADAGVWLAPLAVAAAAPSVTGRQAVAALAEHVGRWWLHIDLDVLDPQVFAAQGLPGVPDEPGGLQWPQLVDIAGAVVESGGCVGLSLAIYDPDQDIDGGDAARIVAFVQDLFARMGGQ
ncbi:arginase family protein [Mycolicibacterium sp. S2-37]|uniref:arginase family protein n=1 Tax=Mycolicibacterium sp. S2-37 TaxID=2810297 RepID=UPI001A95170E|nr:arginase family protein [Mycolicibacterium sp. S2-37]MBO0677216.1 arginase family protein [Mycolicibacterium sp. S2-37]